MDNAQLISAYRDSGGFPAGSNELATQLLERYQGLCKNLAFKKFNQVFKLAHAFTGEDLLQIAKIGLLETVSHKNLDLILNFESFIYQGVKTKIDSECRHLIGNAIRPPYEVQERAGEISRLQVILEGIICGKLTDADRMKIDAEVVGKILSKGHITERNTAEDLVQDARRWLEQESLPSTLATGDDTVSLLTDSRDPCFETVNSKQAVSRLAQIVDQKLSENEKRILDLLFYDDMTLRQAAKVMNVRDTSVMKTRDRAIKKIQKCLRDHFSVMDCDDFTPQQSELALSF